MSSPLKILILEDLPSDVDLIVRALKKGDFQFETLVVDNKKEYEHALKEFSPDLVLSDHSLPSFNSIEAIHLLKARGLKIPFILTTATISEEYAVEVMKEGAYDYILKDRMGRLPAAISSALEKSRLERERQKYHDQVIANEVLLNDAERLAKVGSWSIDMIHHEVKWSDETFRIYGYQPGEVTPSLELILNHIHHDDINFVNQTLDHAIKTAVSKKFDYRIIGRNGNTKYISSELLIKSNEKNEATYLLGYNQDITDAVLAKESLKKSESNLKTIFENSETAYVLLDTNMNIVAFNDLAQQWSRRDLQIEYKEGLNYISLIKEDRKKIVKETMQHVLEGGKADYDLQYPQADGSFQWYNMRMNRIQNKEGATTGICMLVSNTTQRKKAESDIRNSELRFREFFETAPEAIFLIDPSTKCFIDFNDNALRLLKYTSEELKTKSPVDISPPFQPDGKRSNEKTREMIIQTLRGEKPISEWMVRDSADILIFCEIRLTLLTTQDRHLIRVSVIEITDRKDAEHERDKAVGDIIQRNKDLEQFSYIISHNLRAPVANILGLTEALKTQNMDEVESKEIVRGLTNSSLHLDNVIKDLNQILQIRQNTDQNKKHVHFSELVSNIKAILSDQLVREQVTIQTDFTEVDDIFILKSYMHSIFYNLISNSIKFRQPDLPCLITIKSGKLPNGIELIFRDNGMGIDLTKTGHRLFGLYKRFHPHIEGKGMGLFMVKTQVETLGGKIAVESEVNKGTEFTIEFENVV